MKAFGTILALLFLGGLLSACDQNEYRVDNSKAGCANAAPDTSHECEGQFEYFDYED